MAAPMLKICCGGRNFRNFVNTSKALQCLLYSSKGNDDGLPINRRPASQFDLDSIMDDSRPVQTPVSETLNLQDDAKVDRSESTAPNIPPKSFATLLRESKFMQLGDLAMKVVKGRIFEVQGDDLYIDFGGKFYCVCTRPAFQSARYKRGAAVKLRLNKFEMTAKFIGSEKHMTLLEADCTLLGLIETVRDRDYVQDSRGISETSDVEADNTNPVKPGGLAASFVESLGDHK